ncbi:ribonuclease P protein subunit Rpp21 [Aphomia sociella]
MKKVQGNDSFQRINFLYQISKEICTKNPALSSYYGNLIVNIAKKNVLKIHPDIKRQMCKTCRCMLIDNVTATIKIKSRNKSKIIEWTCKTCGAKRSLPAEKNKDHTLWVDRSEAVVEVIN